MPRIRTSRTRPPPEGFEDIEPILEEYETKMRDAENESHEGKRKSESLWPIMRITHTRSRYIYDLYYKREAISRELYDWLVDQGYADAAYVPRCARSRQAYREVEAARVRKAVLRAVHPGAGAWCGERADART
ncbi:Component of the SF3b subcomplex of the U2 snRNP [Malassezia sp. CBS 17886]|nr:Component of the SF3b subcomplex of the U2 snRNP [Malassezia sp. CBS 17886]